MTKKCLGCGALFQMEDPKKAGFIEKENFDKAVICKRCFRIKNYGDYEVINKDIKDYQKIFDEISKKRDLILFLCDIFTLDESLNYINKLNGKVILVITKKDLLPKSVKEYKLINYIKKNYNLNIVDIIFVSSNKNYNIDLLYNLVNKRKVSSNVYLVGNTNAGKSTLFKILGLVDTPSSGAYKINGIDTTKLTDKSSSIIRMNNIGFVFQDFNLDPYLNALEITAAFPLPVAFLL